MKGLPSAATTLAIIAAAAIGVLTTWMIMREPQPVLVVVEKEAGRTGSAAQVTPVTASAPTSERTVKQKLIATFSNPTPVIISRTVVTNREKQKERAETTPPERSGQPVTVTYQQVNAPVVQQTNQLLVNNRVSPARPENVVSGTTVDDALSYALEAADPYLKEGFALREDYWGGDLAVKGTKAIVHQLFRGNEYWFWAGTGVKGATISVDVYDGEGNLAEAEAWNQPHVAAARVVPKKTGSYYLIVRVEKSEEERTAWALTYGFR